MARVVEKRLFIAWDLTSFVNESAYLISANGDMSYTPPGEGFSSGRGIISSMTISLDNSTARFSPLNTGGALYSYLQNGKSYHAPCYLEVSINGGTDYYRIFTGVIKWPEIVGGTTRATSVATLECRSNEEKLLQHHTSTTLADFVTYHDTGYDESQLITAWLTDAGIDPGDMDVDSGAMTIAWAWMDDESVIEEIWRLAAACGGRFYADPDGVFQYENFTNWARETVSTTTQAAYTPDSFSGFEPVYNDRDLFNSVLVEAAPRETLTLDTVWEPDEIIRILPGETRLIVARLRQPAYNISAIDYTARSAGGISLTASVSMTATKYAQRVEMEFTNSHATHTAYIDPISIVGQTVSGSITIEEERNANDHGANGAFFADRGDRRKSIRGNVYIQSRAHAAMIAEFLMRQSETPRLSYKLSGCPGDPALRLGWKISIADESIMSSTAYGIVSSVRWRFSQAGYTQDLECIDTTGLFVNSNYFIVGTSKLGSSGAGIGKLFF